jgi:hypothetical protein
MTGPQPMTEGVHRARAQAAEAAYEAAVEAASSDVDGRPR